MIGSVEVAILGAGPYGLSIAAHLQSKRVSFRIFGVPMQLWREGMPEGMLLKSDGFASNLSDPEGLFTLQAFCKQRGLAYDRARCPVPLETFRDYGLAFQRQVVPQLEEVLVTKISRRDSGFELELQNGETARANRVIVAVGVSHFRHMPVELAGLPRELCTHSSAHASLARFKSLSVTVVGGGASAIDLATLLSESGADVTLLARKARLKIQDPPDPGQNGLWDRIRHPQTMIGPGLRARFFTDFPGIFRRLPESTRLRIVRTFLGPSAGYPMKARFIGKVPVLLGCHIVSAEVKAGRVHLHLGGSGAATEHVTDHVVAATGYRVDLERLTFLDAGIRDVLRTVDKAPALAANFESSVPGLHFVGVASANTFGPMMRFACGSEWTAKRIARSLSHLACREGAPRKTSSALAPTEREKVRPVPTGNSR